MPAKPPKKLQPEDFEVNQVWLAFRMNSLPLIVGEEEIDLFVLQDAASMFILGNAFAPHGAESPEVDETRALFEQAYAHKAEWPTQIMVLGKPSKDNSFLLVARENGVEVEAVSEARMSFYIKDAQTSFEEFLQRRE